MAVLWIGGGTLACRTSGNMVKKHKEKPNRIISQKTRKQNPKQKSSFSTSQLAGFLTEDAQSVLETPAGAQSVFEEKARILHRLAYTRANPMECSDAPSVAERVR